MHSAELTGQPTACYDQSRHSTHEPTSPQHPPCTTDEAEKIGDASLPPTVRVAIRPEQTMCISGLEQRVEINGTVVGASNGDPFDQADYKEGARFAFPTPGWAV